MTNLATPTEQFRQDIYDKLKTLEFTVEVDDKPLSVYKWLDVHNAVMRTPEPEPTDNAAALRSPARVVVWAGCPICGIRQPVSVFMEPVLSVSEGARELKVKASSKAVSHICGQTVWGGDADEEPVEGQQSLDDALDENDEASEDEDASEEDAEPV